MKKLLVVLLAIASFSLQAQDRRNEVRLNALSVLVYKQLDLTYEYVINEESSVGLGLAFDLDKKNNNGILGGNQDYAITPYYRYHLPADIAQGIFFETFISANGGVNKKNVEDVPDYLDLNLEVDEDGKVYPEYSDFAFGLGGGYKYISESGFVGELYGGAGRNMSGGYSPEILVRLGVSFGFRF